MKDSKVELSYHDDLIYANYTCPYCNVRNSKYICHASKFDDNSLDYILGENFCPSTMKIYWLVK